MNPDPFYLIAAQAPDVPEWFKAKYEDGKPVPDKKDIAEVLNGYEYVQYMNAERELARLQKDDDSRWKEVAKYLHTWHYIAVGRMNTDDPLFHKHNESLYFAWRKYYAEKILTLKNDE